MRYGLRAVPRVDDPNFVSAVAFDPAKPAGTPKRKFAYLFPSKGGGPGDTALIQVRLKAGLSEAQRGVALRDIRAAVAMREWKPANGATYTVTGAPVVVADLAASISGAMWVLLVVALLVMALTLALVFSGRPRLLALGVALAATALTFGVLALAGASLTMASIAVLPVLIGLAVDYAIQLQARVQEEARHGDVAIAPAARRAALLGAPAVAVAAAATAAGFAALALSPVPMVRDFGILLVAGIAIAFGCALFAGTAALVLADRASAPARLRGRRAAAAGRVLRAARARAAAGPAARRVRHAATTALSFAIARPARVLAIAVALAAAGWALDTQTRVESDIQKLVPQDLPALRDLDALQRSTGVGGEIDVIIEGADLTRPAVLNWMIDYQTGVLERFRLQRHARLRHRASCARPSRCPTSSPRPPRGATPAPSGRCSTPCRRTSRSRSSAPTGAPRRWPSASASWTSTTRPPSSPRCAHGWPTAGRPGSAHRSRACPYSPPTPTRRSPRPPDGCSRCSPACSQSPSCCSPRCETWAGHSSRSCRSRWPPAGRRCCCSPCACR